MNIILKSTVLMGAMVLSGAAYAGDPASLRYAGHSNESPIRGKGPFSVVHNEPASPRPGHTTEQINDALRFLGRCCEIGTSRVLSDDHAGTTRTESTSTITYRAR